MTKLWPRLQLISLTFTGAEKEAASLSFSPGFNVLYGASNTGKSFSAKAIDFMLGGSALPNISARNGYDQGWLSLNLPKSGDSTLVRALVGGGFELFPGYVGIEPRASTTASERDNVRKLAGRHSSASSDNISAFLLDELGLSGREIATDVHGKKRPLSFRDLTRFSLIDETAIQAETSPVESGQNISPTTEHSVLKLLLTGQDDSKVLRVVDARTLKTTTGAKVELIDEAIARIDEELEADYPNPEQLPDQFKRLEDGWAEAQREAQIAQQSIRDRLTTKNNLARAIFDREQRRAEIEINFGRFEQLESVYQSDIKRLQSIEEAGFVLALGGDKNCPLCGASPDDQKHSHGMADIKRARDAANTEINKIKARQNDLRLTIDRLDTEGLTVANTLEDLNGHLIKVEGELSELAPAANSWKKRLDEVLGVRDHVRHGMELLEQRKQWVERKEELLAIKPTKKADRPQLGASTTVLHDFAQTVSSVLEEWQFPGRRHVSFDEGVYDIIIDGNHRRDNGKGVRAVTHAAFKVALLMFCHERQLPHPGFLVLDTPLLTYRDPIKTKKPLSDDEQLLKNTSLKDFFFEHLATVSKIGQIIVIENVDPPANIASRGKIEQFTGDPSNGRFGLFPHTQFPTRD